VTRGARASPVIVLEVGGTSLRAAYFDPERRVLERRLVAPTPNHLDGERADLQQAVMAAMRTLVAQVLNGDRPAVVAVAYPGPIDEAGRVLATPTVLGAGTGEPFALQQACEGMWPGATVYTLNDLTAAGYRYVAAGLRDFAVVTVGSGIGHKVFLDGRPRVGPGGRGGEIGHLRLDLTDDAPRCECGGRGHLGGLASGRGTVAGVRRRAAIDPDGYTRSALARHVDDPRRIDAPALVAAYRAQDAFTVAAVREAARYLGQGLAAIHVDTGVERILMVGGFAIALGESYRKLVAAAAADACWRIGQDWDAIVRLGEPDDDPGLLGSGLFASGLVGR
jgi:predicted NBD/HSP70 family sugar kinase